MVAVAAQSLPPTAAAPPPGVEPRVLPGSPSLARMLRDETEGRDDIIDPAFFEPIAQAPIVEHAWRPWDFPANLFPMVYSDFGLIMASYTLPVAQARSLLPASSRLSPARLTSNRAVIIFFAFDYRRGGLGAYREFGVAIPVMLDAPNAWPAVGLLRDRWSSGSVAKLGMYAVQLPVDRPRACEAGIRLYGLPKLVGEATVDAAAKGGRAEMHHDGQLLARLQVDLGRLPRQRRRKLDLTTLSVLDGRIIRTRYDAIGIGYRGMRGRAEVEIGEHPRFSPFKTLDLSRRPLEVRAIPRMNWIIWGPEDVGPV